MTDEKKFKIECNVPIDSKFKVILDDWLSECTERSRTAEARCEDLRTQLERMKEERDGLKRELESERYRPRMISAEYLEAMGVKCTNCDRLQELLDSTTAQLTRTQGERDELGERLTMTEEVFCKEHIDRLNDTWKDFCKAGDVEDEITRLKRSRHEWKRRWKEALWGADASQDAKEPT